MFQKHLFLLDNFLYFVYNKDMLKIAMILMLVAVVILAVCVCIMRKNNYLTFLLKTLSIIAIVCLGFIVANFKDDFSGFSILVILSVLPMILAAVDMSQFVGENKEEVENSNNDTQKNETEESLQEPTSEENKKIRKQNILSKSNGNFFFAIGAFLSAVCLAVATLYVGKETFFGAIIGLLIGGGATFAFLAIKKTKNVIDIISYILIFCSIGLMVSNIILALLYSQSISNIMFCLGCLLFGVYSSLRLKFNKNYINAVYYASTILLLLSILL